MKIKEFFDNATFTLTYVIHCEDESVAVVIDPVLDFDPASGRISEDSINSVTHYLKAENLQPTYCLETHAHADHLSGSQALKRSYPDMQVAISERIQAVQDIFFNVFHMSEKADGKHFDYLFGDNEVIKTAGLQIQAIPTPGHTPACSSFLVSDQALFTGDSVFMPDYGVGRCDFPGGSASTLYSSVTQNIYTLPDALKVYVGHDYQPGGRSLQFQSTIGELKKSNIQLNGQTSAEEFITKREARDKTLAAPRLLLPSIQVNIVAGHLPAEESNGKRYLKIPLSVA